MKEHNGSINEIEEINELFNKAYDLNSNIIFFPVRHHSPVCSYHLLKTIEEYNPQIILIEGLVDGNSVKEFLCHEDSRAPFSMYYSYSDSKGFISEEKECYKCYYPFLDYSPELVALRKGKEKNVETEFIDLSYGEILIATKEGKGLLKSEDKATYNDDYLLDNNTYIKSLCREQNCRDFNELWEKLFEIQGIDISTEDFIRNMLSYCYLTRINTKEETLIQEGCIAREMFMAEKIQKAVTKYKKILVVTGGFHTYGIMCRLQEENNFSLHDFNEDDSSVYVMPYSMEAVNMLNGYASGMPYPHFYESVWSELAKGNKECYEKAVLQSIIQTGKRARKEDEGISTYDEICAFNMCRGLAAIRDKNCCGVYELIDGIKSSFIKGELCISTEGPLKNLYEEITGDKIGVLCKSVNIPPIIEDFRNLCKVYNMNTNISLEQKAVLDIFSLKKHRETSIFLHRMQFLDTGFAVLVKGPDFLMGRNVNLTRETWKYKWSAAVDSTLIDNSVYGGTLEEAVTTIVKKKILCAEDSCSEVSRILSEAFNMGLNSIFKDTIFYLKDVIGKDNNFYSLMNALSYLSTLYNMRELYGMDEAQEIKSIISCCYNKVNMLIPQLRACNDDEALKAVDGLKDVFTTLLNRDLNLDDSILKESLNVLIEYDEGNSAVEGAALGILYGIDEISVETICERAKGYILGTDEKMCSITDFLCGLFACAKDIVFIDDSILKCIDVLVKGFSDEELIRIIPQMRLAFSYFTPRELDQIGARIAEFYNVSVREIRDVKAVSPQVLKAGRELDRVSIEILKQRGYIE